MSLGGNNSGVKSVIEIQSFVKKKESEPCYNGGSYSLKGHFVLCKGKKIAEDLRFHRKKKGRGRGGVRERE